MSSYKRLKKEELIVKVTFKINYLLYNNYICIYIYIYCIVYNIELVYSTK